MPLFSESIPIFPYFLDIPKHLAVLSSAVIRQASLGYRSAGRSLGVGQESLVEEFTLKCFGIESRIIQSIDTLTSYQSHPRHYQSTSSQRSSSPSSPDGHSMQNTTQPHQTQLEEELRTNCDANGKAPIRQRSRASSKRPSTAPAISGEVPLHPPLSSPATAPYCGTSDGSASTSPPMSPVGRMFNNPEIVEQSSVATPLAIGNKTTPTVLRRTMSQQLDPQEIEAIEDVAKRRKKFLPAFLARAPKQ